MFKKPIPTYDFFEVLEYLKEKYPDNEWESWEDWMQTFLPVIGSIAGLKTSPFEDSWDEFGVSKEYETTQAEYACLKIFVDEFGMNAVISR